MPYVQVAAPAAVPASRFYVSLFFQVDAYAAKYGIRGLPREELPSLGVSFKMGWFYYGAGVLLHGAHWFPLVRPEAPAGAQINMSGSGG